MAEVKEKMLNGIDVGALQEAVETLRGKPELAKFTFRSSNKWINGTHNQARVRDFHGMDQEHGDRPGTTYEIDEPTILLGQDRGPNPVEWVLIGLSGCLTTSLVAYAAAKGVHLRSVESELEGDLDVRGFLNMDENVRNGYQTIRVKFHIESDASDEQLQELVEIAQQRSPVYDIVTNKVPVEVNYQRR